MTIEHILGRHPIEFTEQEAIDILAAATGLPCADTYADGIGFEDPGDAATEAGAVFAQQFAGRRFSSLTDALLSVIDIQSEMLQAAGSRDSRGGVLQSIADQLGLGAPPSLHSAQGEPAAWVTADTVDGQAVNGKPRRIWWENNEGVGIPIYAAPQPAEQQPTISDEIPARTTFGGAQRFTVAEQQPECGCCGRSDRCDDDCDAVALRRAEQQPAPDVAGLVEALKWLRGAINCTPENDKHQSGAWISTSHPRIRQIDELLAAHRSKGGDT